MAPANNAMLAAIKGHVAAHDPPSAGRRWILPSICIGFDAPFPVQMSCALSQYDTIHVVGSMMVQSTCP